jgi:predicted alpha/beta hydrolase family esterase
MNALKAHVENGRIIVDEPTDLPDGTVLRVVPLSADDPELDAEERERILRAIDAGQAAARRGEHVNAEEFVDELLAQA